MVSKFITNGLTQARKIAFLAGAAAVAVSAPAHAFDKIAAMPVALSLTVNVGCVANGSPLAAPQVLGGGAPQSKSGAILGERMSALEQIRSEQETSLVNTPPVAETGQPSFNRCAFSSAPLAIAEPQPLPAEPMAAANTDFLASSRVRIGTTPFTTDWARVQRSRLAAATAASIVEPSGSDELGTIRAVNSWVNNSIEEADDQDLYGRADYWAAASETLALQQGDCEDFAILKFQLLLALGFRPEDMYLTLARDLVRGADHALLVVRQPSGYYVLDNATNELLPADQTYDYRPFLSFSGSESWLHSAPDTWPERSVAHLSVSATSNPLEMGLNR